MPRIAVVHPSLILGGGSEAPALWTIEALKDENSLTLITMTRPDFVRMNEWYGTNLNPDEIHVVEVPPPRMFQGRFAALKGYRLARYCRQNSDEYDLMISTYNVMDFGRSGIQFIADFSFDDRLRRAYDFQHEGFNGLLYKNSVLRQAYIKLSEVLSGWSEAGWKMNFVVANSDWTAGIMQDHFGLQSRTVYPPVVGNFPEISWEDREYGFVCVGRLVPEKRMDKILRILKGVRQKKRDIHLHAFGKGDASSYVRNLSTQFAENSEWACLEGTIFGTQKYSFFAGHKFGISGRENEPFGIAVAEMVKAGCIVWVPAGGGQTEIVNHPELIYDSEEDAVHKIGCVLESGRLQSELREHLARQAKKFSVEGFVSGIRDCVRQFWEDHGTP